MNAGHRDLQHGNERCAQRKSQQSHCNYRPGPPARESPKCTLGGFEDVHEALRYTPPMFRFPAASHEEHRRLQTALLLALGGTLLLHMWLFFTWRQEVVEGYPDFISFYTAGKMVLRGLGSRLYDPHVQEVVQAFAASRVQYRQGPLLYNHPPFEALIFAPYALFSYVKAYVLWALVNVFLLCGSTVLLWPYLPNLRRFSPAIAGLLVFSAFPVFVSLLL